MSSESYCILEPLWGLTESRRWRSEIATAQRVLFLAVIELALRDAAVDTRGVRHAALRWLLDDDVDFPRICGLVACNRSDYASCSSVGWKLSGALVSRERVESPKFASRHASETDHANTKPKLKHLKRAGFRGDDG